MKTGSKVTLGIVALAAGALALLKKNGVAGIGAVDWYNAVWRAENELDIDLSQSYFAQPQSKMYDLKQLAKQLGYRNSTVFSDARAFYRALQTKKRTLSIDGIGEVADEHMAFDLYLWCRNTSEIWNKHCMPIAYLLVRKMKKGLVPDADYLANSSVVDNIARITIRDYNRNFPISVDTATRKLLKKQIADAIISEADEEYQYAK